MTEAKETIQSTLDSMFKNQILEYTFSMHETYFTVHLLHTQNAFPSKQFIDRLKDSLSIEYELREMGHFPPFHFLDSAMASYFRP